MQVAQLNIAKMKATADHPSMADFFDNLDYINGLAEKSQGFVWRLKGENDNATAIKIFEDDFMIINLSVWENIASLSHFVYQTIHADFIKRKKEWFSKLTDSHLALWYINDHEFPSPKEAKERLEYLHQHGNTPKAFGFKKIFTEQDYQNYLSY